MTTRIKLRRDTAANWTTTNPILAAGEPGLETDTGKIKYGNGVSRWNTIEHTGGDALTNVGAITVQTGDADRWLVRLRQEDDITQPDVNIGVIVYSTNYDSNGNVIVLASIDLTVDNIAAFKFTSAGELVWKTILNPEDNFYNAGHAAVTPTNDIVFCLGNESVNVIVVKLNGETGAVEFSQEVELGLYHGIDSVAVDSTGNIIIAGTDRVENTEQDLGLIVKLSGTAGAILWQTTLAVDNNDTRFLAAAVDFNNDVIVTGSTYVATPDGVNATEEVIVVAKFAGTDGEIIWQKTVALEVVRLGIGVGLSLDSVGNIYVCGSLLVANPEADIPGDNKNSNAAVVFKMSAAGVIAWDRRIGPGPCSWVGVSTAVGSDGDLYLYGATYQRRINADVNSNNGNYDQSLILARFNKTTGAVVWQSYFNNPNAQETPGFGNPEGGGNSNTLDVFEDRIIIGGTVRLGPSDTDQMNNQITNRYFTQGFIAQFDTDATKFSVDGWTLEPSYITGKLTNTLIATNGPMENGTPTKTVGTALSLTTTNTGISVSRRASKTNTWSFGKDGTFTTPADTNIKLQQTQLGYANMYGVWNNQNNIIWFESVTHDAEGFAYVLGSDEWEDGFAHIYKFTPEGTLVWQRQLYSNSGATFNVTYENNIYTEVTVSTGGMNYKVGDKIVLGGGYLGGSDGINSLTLTVATINNSDNGIGEVATVTIVGGVANGSGSASSVADFYDNAECEVQSMTFDPVTGNPVIVISMPTYNGDTLDQEWTETVVLLIDSGSGVVLSSTTLSDEGDIYPNDVAVSVTGKVAIVGEKYNEYAEYGAVTPLSGSGIDKLLVAKSDIDAEHYPGEANGWYGDWLITGNTITGQTQVTGVNNYTGLTPTVLQGSGAVFTINTTSATSPTSLGDIAVAFNDSGTGQLTYGYATTVTVGSATDPALKHCYYYDNGSGGLFTRIGFYPGTYTGYTVASDGSINGDTTTAITVTVDGVSVSLTPFEGGGVYDYAVEGSDAFGLISKVGQTLAVSFGVTTTGSYSILVTSGGANYLPGHKIKILGTSVPGAENTNLYEFGTAYATDEVYFGGPDSETGQWGLSIADTLTEINSLLAVGTTITITAGSTSSVSTTILVDGVSNGDGGQFYIVGDLSGLGTSGTTPSSIRVGLGTYSTGATPENDIIITVASVAAGGAIESVSNTGTPNVAAVGPYTGLTGINHEVGSGALISLTFNPVTGAYESWNYTEAGTNYVSDDLITISGTQFAGGTSPANDFTFTVLSSGGITDVANITGSVPSTHLLIRTNASVNFADEATFAIKQVLGGEAFIWTPDWNNAMGGNNTDLFGGVVWNAAGTSLYAVGTGRYETTYNQALVTKWSSTGTLQASTSINSNVNNDGASHGAVALMADGHIVTAHTMYNIVRNEVTEVLVTKLDSNLAIVWQQFIGVWSDDDGWESPQERPSVVVDPATDEILVVWETVDGDFVNDDTVYIVKLDTDGDVIWKRGFGVHESDTQLRSNTKVVSISGNKYTVVGRTDAPNDSTSNAMIFTMPLDGTGLGQHGLWWYFEPNDDQIKVMKVTRESDAFTPNVNSGAITAADNVKYYFTDYPNEEFTLYREVVRSEVGGAVEFADGSRQSFSTAIIPQVKISAGRYTIRPEDSGRHILVESQNYNIIIPNYRQVTLPVGFTFTVVNISGDSVTVENQSVNSGERGEMRFSGGSTVTPYAGINDNGSGQMVTLMKIKEGTTSDDGESHGDIWMIAGADIFDND
mgnify:CR=1 FL=1|jgi:hypothetical protein